MQRTPKSLRLHIGLFGRMNVGKSSFLNMIAGQDIAITSPEPGTTTDVVEKTMELLPLGPVVFLDTAGLDDVSSLGQLRVKKTERIFERAEIAVLLCEPDEWTDYEEQVAKEAKEREIPFLIVINKIDLRNPSEEFIAGLKDKTTYVIECSSINFEEREKYIHALKDALISLCPEEFLMPPPLVGDLLPAGSVAVLIVPIDLQAPKGRLILPQVQTIRDALDNDAATVVVKEREYRHILELLREPPALVICDSQIVMKMVADTPRDIKCTTFSTLFCRYKGDLIEMARGVKMIDRLKSGDKVLIAEACSHHPLQDDIGRVKIPRWLRQYTGLELTIDVSAGRDFPENIREYKLIIHCGGCMFNRREMLFRIQKAKEAGVAMTNYGVCISFVQGVLQRVLEPFPAALDAFNRA